MDRSGAEPTVLQNRRARGRAADAYVAGFAHSHDQELRSFCRSLLFERLRGNVVLDVGAGSCQDARQFSETGLDVIAVDHCQALLIHGRAEGVGVGMICADMTMSALAPAFVDGIYAY